MKQNGTSPNRPRGKGQKEPEERFKISQVFEAFTSLPRVLRLVWSTDAWLTGTLALLSLVRGFISHRFSTVRLADRILVLENGKIIENGPHQELIALNGRYAELFNLQAEAYR
jgi:ABC-type multidrug transport system fused ATPase/permease subunit